MSRRTTRFLLGLLSAVGSASASAQAADPAAPERMERLRSILAPVAGMAGQWEGEARAVTGPGRTLVLRQTEDVVWGAGRTVLFVRGTGYSTEASSKDSVVFDAAAVVWADAESGAIRMRAYRDGQEVDVAFAVRGDTLEWGFPVPGGRVQYVIALTPDTWHEVGHFVRDGGGRFPIVELRLRRKR